MTSRRSKGVLLTIGTKKGLFLFQSDQSRAKWQMSSQSLGGSEVNHAVLDARTGRLFATNNGFEGCRVSYSNDLGKTWTNAKENPKIVQDLGMKVDPASGVSVSERLWRIQPGRPSEPGVLYCGAAPAEQAATKQTPVEAPLSAGPVS
ncbi:MAG: hypothetical protein EXR48_03360 [Dehalococcoidia bacterium]|nr:hypothetical protein [Dehalococcoidia bacterium]